MRKPESACTRAQLGQQRCFWSMRIHEALRHRGLSAATIAHELGLSQAAVSATILGKNHSARILSALRAAGVPEEYLFDPNHNVQTTETITQKD